MGPPEKAHLETARETFYHIVRQEYWRMIDEGRVPSNSPAVNILLDSIDESLDDLTKPVYVDRVAWDGP